MAVDGGKIVLLLVNSGCFLGDLSVIILLRACVVSQKLFTPKVEIVWGKKRTCGVARALGEP